MMAPLPSLCLPPFPLHGTGFSSGWARIKQPFLTKNRLNRMCINALTNRNCRGTFCQDTVHNS